MRYYIDPRPKSITETCSCGASITYPTYPYSVQIGNWQRKHGPCREQFAREAAFADGRYTPLPSYRPPPASYGGSE